MKIVILGAGISGLSAAWFLNKKYPAAEITLLEKKERVGGWIQSKQVGPFLFELGPRTFQAGRCQELLHLIDQVGLASDLRWAKSGKRYLLREGKLVSIGALWPLLFRMVGKDLFAKRGNGEESIASFAARRFGKEGAEQLFDPMTLGVYGGDFTRLSLENCFPLLASWEKEHRSLFLAALRAPKTDHRLFTLASGMNTLCEEIVRQLPITVHLETTVETLQSDGVVAGGCFYPADRIISALPVEAIASILGELCPVRSETLHVVNLGYLGNVGPKSGYGYLVPTRENEALLGMIWDTSIFPINGQTKFTAMVRGGDPINTALEGLSRHLRIERSPDAIFHTEAKVPQYELGHAERIQAFKTKALARYPTLFLLGNYLSGVSVNSCLRPNISLS